MGNRCTCQKISFEIALCNWNFLAWQEMLCKTDVMYVILLWAMERRNNWNMNLHLASYSGPTSMFLRYFEKEFLHAKKRGCWQHGLPPKLLWKDDGDR